jgi:oxygen-independent coproporphyrinogen III oxidase
VPDTALPRSLYVHVPFCVRRCSYCDFAVQATPEAPVTPWLEAVTGELRLLSREQRWSAPLELDTVYVGGGTPSMLGTGAMAAMRAGFAPLARWDPAAVEWTAEANPESFTLDLARDWREAGVNRVSLGVQTFHEPALRWMGRMHGAEGPARAMAAARGAGFENVSVDLIFGLPSRLGRDWSDDLDRALARCRRRRWRWRVSGSVSAPISASPSPGPTRNSVRSATGGARGDWRPWSENGSA